MVFFGELAGLVSLLAYCVYIVSMFRGKTRPNRATWWIWAVVGFIIASSYYFSGATTTMWVPLSNSVVPLIIAVISLKYGEGGWTPFDRRCLTGALFGLLLWWLFNSPFLALLANIFVDFMGALPTIKKTYHAPFGENRLAWVLFLAANALNLFALDTWNFAVVVLPAYFFLLSLSINILIFFPRKKLRKRGGTETRTKN